MSNVEFKELDDLPALPPGWTYKQLGDLLQTNGLSYGIVQPGTEDPSGVSVIRVKNLKSGRILTDEVLHVSKNVEAAYQRTRLTGGEVLLSLVGSVGEAAVAPHCVNGWNVARAIAVIRVEPWVSSSWVQLCLSSDLAQHHMQMWQTTTVQATLNLRDVRRIPIMLPPVGVRQGIMAVIGAIDDKIAVNDRIADTARRLARSYFQFAIEVEDTVEVEISTVTQAVTRGVAPRYTEDPPLLRVLNQKCVRDGRVTLGPSRWTIPDKVPSVKLLRPNDVLVNSTGVGTLGRVARWMRNDACTVDSHVSIVRFDPVKIDPVCAGFSMLEAEPQIEALGEGSTGQTELSRIRLSALHIAVPSRGQIIELRPKLDVLEARGDMALEESIDLARLRDYLLPRLMSGEIRVRDAEKAVEDVM